MENDQLTIALDAKKQEIKEKLEGLAQRRKEIFQKDRNSWTQGFACDLYLKECEQKKHRALEKYRREQKNNAAKRQEIVQLKKKIQKLKFRQEELQKKIGKYKRFEEFLQKIFDALPSTEYGYLAYGEDSLVKTLIKRHRTLVTEKERLLRKLSVQQYSLQETLHEFRVLQEEYNTAQYMVMAKVSELQSKYNELQTKNTDLMQFINTKEDLLTKRCQELSRMLLAVSGLAEQCYMRHYGALQEMTLWSKLSMIQEFILEKMQIKEETKSLIKAGKSSITLLKEQLPKQKYSGRVLLHADRSPEEEMV